MKRIQLTPHLGRRLAVLAVVLASTAVAMADNSLGRVHSSMVRMEPARLKAATEDVQRIQAQRQPVALQTGLNDYRSILHAHAEDSAHTGGTRPEMLADAKKANVSVIMLSDHFRPPRDFIDGSWRGLHDGVLFIPGSETHGFLIYPSASIMDKMELEGPPFIEAVTANDGLIFLSHVEARFNHPMDGLTGIEAYNRHADAMDDMLALVSLVNVLTDPARFAVFSKSLEDYPDAMLASQLDYPQLYMNKWDKETQHQRVVGVAANDCHHNMVMIAKKIDDETVGVGTIVDKDEDLRKLTAALNPGVTEITKGHQPGDVLARLDFDPYYRSFLNVSTHILAPELTEAAIRAALQQGHAYISHDWMCDPTGTVVALQTAETDHLVAIVGDETPFDPALRLVAEFPVACDVRLLKDGEEITKASGRSFEYTPDGPGVYRLEAWLKVDGEDRIWIYANPIYIR